LIGTPGQHDELLLALAERAAPDPVFGCLHTFSSRQIVILIWTFARLKAAAILPDGRLDTWVSAIRAAHEATPLLVRDANNLERSLQALGVDASWIKQSEMLNTWSDLAGGQQRRPKRDYTEEELRAAFIAIDTDESGDIDQEELLAAIRTIKPDADDDTVAKMLSVADADGNATVDFDEFKQIMLSSFAEEAAGSEATSVAA